MATANTNGEQSSGEVYQAINRIRGDMDDTLSEISHYLQPKHLLGYVVDTIRSETASGAKETAGKVLQQCARTIKRHPGPALLLGGAAIWYIFENDDETQPRPRRAPRRRKAVHGAWEKEYDWSTASEDEQTWKQRAHGALDQVRTVIADSSLAAKDKLRAVANCMIGVSGKSREEIHAQWADLPENSGSFVDARTGQPYDDSYGDDASCNSLAACACIADDQQDASPWSGNAHGAVNAISSSLQNTGASVKEQLQALGGHLSGMFSQAGPHKGAAAGRSRKTMTDRLTSAAEGAARMASRSCDTAASGLHRLSSVAKNAARAASRSRDSAASGLHSAADGARHSAERVGNAVQEGYESARDEIKHVLHERPFAVGAACLGIGLLAGLMTPATRRENELMGDAADRLKEKAVHAGGDAVERGRQAASAVAVAASKEVTRQSERLMPDKSPQKGKKAKPPI